MINAVKEDNFTTLTKASSLEELYKGLEPLHLTPGWIDREKPILWEQPSTPFVVKHWEYEYCKSALDAAGRLINTNLAERRNLILRNPVKGNDFATTRTLVNAYQMILPGEEARTHRHAPHALRVIIESEKSFSVVNGEKHPMETGDIVLTPGWCWHGHGHDGDRPAYWLDGLDVPLTHLVEPMFFEEHPAGFAPVERITPDSPYRFTWDTIQKRTEIADKDGDGYFGQRVRLEAAEMPTIGIFVERFFCRFLCPLGALMALGGKLRIFEPLKRREECGSPCKLCSNECPINAIKPSGEIIMDECFYCLDCQSLYSDEHKCPPLVKIRKQKVRGNKPVFTPNLAE